jgi:hypothetical protein
MRKVVRILLSKVSLAWDLSYHTRASFEPTKGQAEPFVPLLEPGARTGMASSVVILKPRVVLFLLILLQESEQHWRNVIVLRAGHVFACSLLVGGVCPFRKLFATRAQGRVSTVEHNQHVEG